jgi:hypothetical protein
MDLIEFGAALPAGFQMDADTVRIALTEFAIGEPQQTVTFDMETIHESPS